MCPLLTLLIQTGTAVGPLPGSKSIRDCVLKQLEKMPFDVKSENVRQPQGNIPTYGGAYSTPPMGAA